MAKYKGQAIDAFLRASQESQRSGRFDDMLEHAQQAHAVDARDLRAVFRLLECLLYCGQIDRVLTELQQIEAAAGDDHFLYSKIAEFYTHCTDHQAALRCFARAVEEQPTNTDYLFSMAASEVATGQIEAAEVRLNEVIRLRPDDHDAYRNRAMLKKQTSDDNHISEIETVLAQGVKSPAGEVQLCYALAKELEDIGEYDRSFECLQRGADKRRSIMRYDVQGDVIAMQKIAEVFDAALFAECATMSGQDGPIFVLGLPRSGTTLVDRIVSSHSRVESLGEVNNFAYSLMHTVGQSADKLSLIGLSAKIDFGELGDRYLRSIRSFKKQAVYLIDKTPANFLYIGLIRLSLPSAKILHVRRNPMDSCFGMYRTLFRAGFPFSYDFGDLAEYYLAYRSLMKHWEGVAPGAFCDIDYEALIADQEGASRRLIEFCGLSWESACLDFHTNSSAVLTASSAQVRRPLYRDALHRWRRYEEHLQPLVERLQTNGVEIDAI